MRGHILRVKKRVGRRLWFTFVGEGSGVGVGGKYWEVGDTRKSVQLLGCLSPSLQRAGLN